MVFSSISFLIIFLPLIVILYYITPSLKVRNYLLLLASLIFYALGEPYYIFLMIISCLFNYIFAILISKGKYHKCFLILAVVFNIAILSVFKYTNFIISILNTLGLRINSPHIALPIGISFFTFQILSYVIDVYRDRSIVQKNFLNLLLYISFFPQLIAGPIVKYHDINYQINKRETSLDGIAYGIRRFIFGLSKKVLISNTLGAIVDSVYGYKYSELNIVVTWIAALLYCLQIYYDFSGYSDMALGLGKVFGFDFKENFNYPYEATSIKEFWRKWHISLSTWFKEYLYIPLGGNRVSKNRGTVNKFIVFFCTGIWHGASFNFIFWGLIHGLFSVLEDRGNWIKKVRGNFIGWLYMITIVSTTFVLFRSNTLEQALFFIKNMFFGFNISIASISNLLLFLNKYNIFIIIISIIGIFNWKSKIKDSTGIEVSKFIISSICLILCIMSLASSKYNPFIYFRF